MAWPPQDVFIQIVIMAFVGAALISMVTYKSKTPPPEDE